MTNLDNEPLEDIIFPGIDGDFKKGFTGTPLLPLGTKYIKFQVLTRPNLETDSTYWIDDIIVRDVSAELVIPYKIDLKSPMFEQHDNSTQMQQLERSILDGKINELPSVVLDQNNRNNINATIIYQTKPVPVEENGIYNLTITVESLAKATNGLENLDQRYPLAFNLIANFANSSDMVETSNRYGAKASAGSVLSISPQSEVYADLDILKPANYTVALRVSSDRNSTGTCPAAYVQCDSIGINDVPDANRRNQSNNESFISLSFIKKGDGIGSLIEKKVIESSGIYLGDTGKKNASVNTSSEGQSELEWLYLSNVDLEKGKYEIRLSSNSNSRIDLDSMVLYSKSDINGEINNSANYEINHSNSLITGTNKIRYEPIEDVFDSNADTNSNSDIGSHPAYIEKYEKIDPTRYEVDIRNATRPYIMSFAESYDPLWVAYVDDSTSNPNGNDKLNINKNNNSSSKIEEENNTFKIRSVPLFSTVNGFYINRTGNYSLVIEYEPQKWFLQAGIVSVAALILSITVLVIQERKLKWPIYSHSINSSFNVASGILGSKYLRFWKRNH
jgi:hypothetical protein